MSSRNARISIRARLVNCAILGSAIVTLATAMTIFAIVHNYLYGRTYDFFDRIVDDLQKEYVEYDGLSEEFQHCVTEDALEHDIRITRISIASPAGETLFATPELPNGDHENLARVATLPDGNALTVVRDTEDIHDFLGFLATVLSLLSVVSVVLSSFGAFIVGGRILRLNDLIADKDKAYRELHHLTDDIAHDLRTPLTRLSMAAETDLLGGNQSEPLAVQVMNESRSMLEMINTMLEISQSEAKIDRSPREMIDMSDFLRNICELYTPVAEESAINLSLAIPDEEVPFEGHKAKLQQLVGNLLDNALKFTQRNGRIEISLRHDSDSIVLSVADSGCGIAATDLQYVFNRFWRADSSRHLPGNGLGLALAKAIVVSYGGKITCSSTEGQGTVFTITLPL